MYIRMYVYTYMYACMYATRSASWALLDRCLWVYGITIGFGMGSRGYEDLGFFKWMDVLSYAFEVLIVNVKPKLCHSLFSSSAHLSPPIFYTTSHFASPIHITSVTSLHFTSLDHLPHSPLPPSISIISIISTIHPSIDYLLIHSSTHPLIANYHLTWWVYRLYLHVYHTYFKTTDKYSSIHSHIHSSTYIYIPHLPRNQNPKMRCRAIETRYQQEKSLDY